MVKHIFIWIAALAVAGASFVQAAAESAPLVIASADIGTSLAANAQATAADKLYRAELAQRGEKAFKSEASFAASPGLQQRIKSAYSVNPLNVAVLRTLAIGVVLPADTVRGRKAVQIAADTSKRDVLTDLWLAQDYAQKQQLDPAMEMFDAVLRTNNAARDTVMVPLLNLLANRDSYRPIGKLLARRPEWEWDFWFAFAANPVALQNAADFMRGASVSPSEIDPRLLLRLYSKLRAADLYDQLFGVGMLDPEARRVIEAEKRGDITAASETNPFAWQFVSAGSYSTYLEKKSRSIRIDAESRSVGTAGLLILPVAGEGSLTLNASAQVPASTLLRISVACATDVPNGETTRLLLTNEIKAVSSTIMHPGCEYLSVRLYFDSSDNAHQASILVNRIAFAPTREEAPPSR